VVDGHSGNITLDAIKWLMRHDIPVFILDYNGTLLCSTLPREPVNGPLRIAQIDAYRDPAKRFYIAKKLVEAKAERTLDVMKWLAARYSELPPQVQADLTNELERLEQCKSLPRLLSIEGRIADIYWRYLQRMLPAKFRFASRIHETHQMNASDPVNALLNYGYAVLESQCRKALNTVGLEPTVGFLHEARQTKCSLVYDVQEPYRWLVDSTVISCLESNRFGNSDFYRMDNYVLRLRPEAVRKLIDALRIKFNSPARYAGKLYGWDTLVRLKAQELANHIMGTRTELDFGDPKPALHRTDSEAVRSLILSLTTAEARKRGIRKNTFWYLQQRARTEKSLMIRTKVANRLQRHSLTDKEYLQIREESS
jgi:CRISPR-associated protein Cas1